MGKGGLKPRQAIPHHVENVRVLDADAISRRGIGTRRMGGGGNNEKRCHSLTDQHINGKLKTKIANTILLLFALSKCAYLLLVSFGTLRGPYIVGQSL